MKRIFVLRLGHRRKRDPRLSTHVALAARAFGAQKMFFSGDDDPELTKSINKIVASWGGDFGIQYVRSWKTFLNDWKLTGRVVHLTMYGVNACDVDEEIRSSDRDLLIVVGGQKVPGELYGIADWNVSVTNQPHSEVSALSVFLHIILGGKEFGLRFDGARIRVTPNRTGKKVSKQDY